VQTLIASPERPALHRPAGVPHPRKTLPADGVTSRSSPPALDARVPPLCNGGLGRFGHDFGRMPVFPRVRVHLEGNGLRSPSGDLAARAADAAADQVIRMPDSAATPGRKPELHADPEHGVTPRQGGTPLPEPERRVFEPRFGVDFGRVRLHADAAAGRLSRALGAEAFAMGSHIYFAPGAWAPGHGRGRRLLAHELAHVVQQAGGTPARARSGEAPDSPRAAGSAGHSPAGPLEGGHGARQGAAAPVSAVPPALASAPPGIQRRLLMTGKPPDVRALLDLLEPASGFTLRHDPKTKEVSITASRLSPPSVVVAGRLATIIDDPDQDAELNLERRPLGVGFGSFPMSESTPLIQLIDVDDMVRAEAKAPGSGVAYLMHEIVENYNAHAPGMQEFSRRDIFSLAHEEALEVERLATGELLGARRGSSRPADFGGRVAYAVTSLGGGTVREVNDYEHYFLVIDHKGEVLTDARRVPRLNVSRRTIAGVAGGADLAADETPPTIDEVVSDLVAVVDDLVANPTATVRIECGDPDPKAAERRAWDLVEAILKVGQGRTGWDLRSARNFNVVAFGLIDLGDANAHARRPTVIVDRPDLEIDAARRGRVVEKWLAGRGRRRAAK
jgi:hypothetical protein